MSRAGWEPEGAWADDPVPFEEMPCELDPAAGFVTDTVEEELAYGMEQLGLDAATMRRRVEETLDLLGIAELRARDLRTLSGGQMQRMLFARLLLQDARLIVLEFEAEGTRDRLSHRLPQTCVGVRLARQEHEDPQDRGRAHKSDE